MARRGCRATSRFVKGIVTTFKTSLLITAYTCLLSPFPAEAGLYTASDQIILLTPENVDAVLFNSTAALVVEFYASWCGHCVAFSPIWKSLARNIKEWKPAIDLAAIDCADEQGTTVCTRFGITGYPSLKFFHAYSKKESKGEDLRGFSRDVRGLRHLIIDKLHTHEETWPPACPPLETASETEIDHFFETNNVQHLALVFETDDSYVGREVTLDLLQYENIAVRRVLNTEEGLVSKLGVKDFPSCYLYYSAGNFSRLHVQSEARAFYTYALQRLPGVVRSGKPRQTITDLIKNTTREQWRLFNSSRVYMSDLESALHYSLRVEVASHPVISGERLTALKRYMSVLAKYFPGRPVVRGLLKTLDIWLQSQHGSEIKYSAFRDILDRTVENTDAVLPDVLRWVGCQGSQPHLRGYPCSVWTLFHVLTVQAKNTASSDPREVLQAMRSYVRSFFGCRECAAHFEGMAAESMHSVNTLSNAVLWLWSRHNRVNNRLAGALSEDPLFPKIQWPSPDQCPRCHGVRGKGEHSWNDEEVLAFLRSYFSSEHILYDYLEDETQVLQNHREQIAAEREEQEALRRRAREAQDVPAAAEEVQEEEEEQEEEQEEEAGQEEMEGAGGTAQKDELDGAGTARPGGGAKSTDRAWWPVGARREVEPTRRLRRPSIIGLKLREPQEDIVDLDSFVNQHYKAKAMRAAAMAGRIKKRSLQRKVEVDELPVEGRRLAGEYVGLEEEAEAELYPRSHEKRWMSLLSVGFSRLDISLCLLLYLLSAMCLLSMYLYFKMRLRLKRAKVALP
ncbi:sulfhydryl oxidase 1 [Chanos chanos]|uniref:Sulfhydryl oxidase n=1 Tax=Chanos chanos TaxID=29144 RepID=A0A6J2W9L6_CHACN|nr:sulfhydryl oxidase 1 [Chanos chanos]